MKTINKILLIVVITFSSVCQANTLDTIRDLSKLPSAEAELTAENIKDRNVKLRFDARMDGIYNTYAQRSDIPDGTNKDQFGFVGRYIKLVLFGNITDKLSYSFRYRMNMPHVSPVQVFSSIDWLNLTYNINDNFFIAAGKQMIYMGGWEYDVAPIDIHIASKWWDNTPLCFAFGVHGGWRSNDKNHTLYLQATNSHLEAGMFNKLFSYGLTWYGNIGFYKAIHSINFLEYSPGKFINYIVLGNKFEFDNFYFYLDWMNRAGSTKDFFSNFSLIAKLNYQINNKFTVFAKGGYDQNLSQASTTPIEQTYDRIILPGTQYAYYGAGVEYTPLATKKHALRLHAFWYGTNNEYMPQSINIGLKWQMNVLE